MREWSSVMSDAHYADAESARPRGVSARAHTPAERARLSRDLLVTSPTSDGADLLAGAASMKLALERAAFHGEIFEVCSVHPFSKSGFLERTLALISASAFGAYPLLLRRTAFFAARRSSIPSCDPSGVAPYTFGAGTDVPP
jgi:hypothetical protein